MKFCYLAWQASMHECMCVCIQSHKHTCVYTFVYSYIHIHALIYIYFTVMYSMYIYLYNMHMQKKHAHKNHTHTPLYIYAFIHTVRMSSHCQGLCVGQLWPGLSANPWKNFLCSHGTLPRWLQCTARPIAAVSATVPVTKSFEQLAFCRKENAPSMGYSLILILQHPSFIF